LQAFFELSGKVRHRHPAEARAEPGTVQQVIRGLRVQHDDDLDIELPPAGTREISDEVQPPCLQCRFITSCSDPYHCACFGLYVERGIYFLPDKLRKITRSE
jgi:hypothetical protein